MEQIIEYATYIGEDKKNKLITGKIYRLRIYFYNENLYAVIHRSKLLADFVEVCYGTVSALIDEWDFYKGCNTDDDKTYADYEWTEVCDRALVAWGTALNAVNTAINNCDPDTDADELTCLNRTRDALRAMKKSWPEVQRKKPKNA